MENLFLGGFCPCIVVPWLDVLMVIVLCGLLLLGYPAAFSLAGTALIFAGIGMAFNVFDLSFLRPFPQRIFGSVTNATLIAVPLFVLMGVILEKSKIAEDLLDACLLYTSPSPRDLSTSRMPSSA